MMQAEQAREELSTQFSKEEFQRTLGLVLDVEVARSEELTRIAQLINKTNQFNLTTIRRTADEVRELAHSQRYLVYAVHVADKFGEYGLTGALILDREFEKNVWFVDTLLLSCRVLGRGVESALLSAVANDARASGVEGLVARFIPTAKNAPATDFLPHHGFVQNNAGDWHIAVSAVPPIPDFVVRNRCAKAA
jgi:FkbH-like protein